MISHKLNEVTNVADSITVLRDGQTIETLDVQSGQLTENRIIRGMVAGSCKTAILPEAPRSGTSSLK